MNNKHYVGKRISSFELYNDIGPITGVALLLDDENELLAGDDSGYMIEVNCPYGTQAIANDILSKLQGKTYKGFRGENAVLDPAAELGDGISVNGMYSMLAHRNVTFGPGHMSDISAPGESTPEHEYKWTDPKERAFKRKLAQTQSMISKTAEEIRLEIEAVDGRVSSITQTIDNLSFSVKGADGKVSEIKLSGDGTIDLSGLVTFSALSGSPGSGQTKINGGWIDAETLHVKAANIDGELNIGLPDDIAYLDDIPTKVSDLSNDAGYKTESGVTKIIKGTVTTDYIYALGVTASILRGEVVDLLDDYGYACGSISLTSASTADYAVEIQSDGAMRILADGSLAALFMQAGEAAYLSIQTVSTNGYHVIANRPVVPSSNGEVYLGTSYRSWKGLYASSCTCCPSDKNLKNSIEELPEKYLVMFDHLTPKRFKMNDGDSGRYHSGYIAQEVKAAMDIAGIDSTEFGGWVKDVGPDGSDIYMLRYEEFGAIYAAKIKQLEARVAELEAKIA